MSQVVREWATRAISGEGPVIRAWRFCRTSHTTVSSIQKRWTFQLEGPGPWYMSLTRFVHGLRSTWIGHVFRC